MKKEPELKNYTQLYNVNVYHDEKFVKGSYLGKVIDFNDLDEADFPDPTRISVPFGWNCFEMFARSTSVVQRQQMQKNKSVLPNV